MNFDKSLVTVSFVPGKSEILFASTNFPETTHQSSDHPAKSETKLKRTTCLHLTKGFTRNNRLGVMRCLRENICKRWPKLQAKKHHFWGQTLFASWQYNTG